MPLDPNDVDARLTGMHDTGWWGVAEQVDAMVFRVTRHADYHRATTLAENADAIHVWIVGSGLDPDEPQPHIVAPGTPGARKGFCMPLVSSSSHGRPWVFAATGWTLPTVIR